MSSSRKSGPTPKNSKKSQVQTTRTTRQSLILHQNSTQSGESTQNVKYTLEITSASPQRRQSQSRKRPPGFNFRQDKEHIEEKFQPISGLKPVENKDFKYWIDPIKEEERKSSNRSHQTTGFDSSLFYGKRRTNNCSSNPEFTSKANVKNALGLRSRKCTVALNNSKKPQVETTRITRQSRRISYQNSAQSGQSRESAKSTLEITSASVERSQSRKPPPRPVENRIDAMKEEERKSSNRNLGTTGIDATLFYGKKRINDSSSRPEFTLEANVKNARVLRSRKCTVASTNSMVSLDGHDQKHRSGTDAPTSSRTPKDKTSSRRRKQSGTSANSSLCLNGNGRSRNLSSGKKSTPRRSKCKPLKSLPVKVKRGSECVSSTDVQMSNREPKIPKLEFPLDVGSDVREGSIERIVRETFEHMNEIHFLYPENGKTERKFQCECTKESLALQPSEEKEESEHWSLCGALESMGSDRIGCLNSSKDSRLYRVSHSTTFRSLCPSHLNRQRSHQCCPLCGQFCSDGDDIISCTGTSSSEPSNSNCHLFHMNCALDALPPSTTNIKCPHCGEAGSLFLKSFTLSSSETLIFLPDRTLSSRTSALGILPIAAKAEREEDQIFNATSDHSLDVLSPLIRQDGVNNNTLESNFPLSDELFIEALEKGKLTEVSRHLSAGGDPNVPFQSRLLKTSIHLAVESNDIVLLHIVCEADIEANINAFDKDGVTPLMLAAKLNNSVAIKYLISTSADHLIQDNEGFTAIHHAVQAGSQEAVDTILEYDKSIINISDNMGLTPLMLAAKMNFRTVATRISEYLEYEKRVVLEIDNENNTSLHWMASSGCIQIALRLLEHGALIDARNKRGETSLHVAIKAGQFAFAVCLLTNGADPTVFDEDGNSITELCNKVEKGLKPHSLKGKNAVMSILKHMKIKSTGLVCGLPLKGYSKSDISKGNENIRIPCVNFVDGKELPPFIYTTSVSSVGSNFWTVPYELPQHICRCHDREIGGATECEAPTELFYDREGRLFQDTDGETETDLHIITECGSECPCDRRKCKNRVIQNGIKALLQVFHTPIIENKTKGWGLRTLTTIGMGNFICEYTGELLSLADLDSRTDDSYMIQLFRSEDNPGLGYVIDSKFRGNASRFVNHSCEANAVLVRVLLPQNKFPRIALFARRTILSNEEITLDYGKYFWETKMRRDNLFCLCKSSACQYSTTESVQKTIIVQ